MLGIYEKREKKSEEIVNGNLENHPFFAPDGHRGHHGHRGRRAWDNAQQSNNTTGVSMGLVLALSAVAVVAVVVGRVKVRC
jgi:hypothetical protein